MEKGENIIKILEQISKRAWIDQAFQEIFENIPKTGNEKFLKLLRLLAKGSKNEIEKEFYRNYFCARLPLEKLSGELKVCNVPYIKFNSQKEFEGIKKGTSGVPTDKTFSYIRSIEEDATILQSFLSMPGESWEEKFLTQHQVANFVRNHQVHLGTEKTLTFFLVKLDEELPAAEDNLIFLDFYVAERGAISCCLRKFTEEIILKSEFAHRIVVRNDKE